MNASQAAARSRSALPEALAPTAARARVRWLETLALPAVAMGLAWLFSPADPLLLNAAFPWLWLAPMLIALRYGVMSGLVSTLLLLANWWLAGVLAVSAAGEAAAATAAAGEFPFSFFFGGVIVVLLCGEFADVWHDRLGRMEEVNLYLSERTSRLTRRHLLLNLSHDRLEQEMLTRPGSIRDTLVLLRNAVLADPESALPAVDDLMQLLVQYTNIEAACLYAMPEQGGAPGPAVAATGQPAPLDAADPLLAAALEQGELMHVAEAGAGAQITTQLVVAPVKASDGSVLAVLAVSKLPFFSISVDNLQLMAVILGYYADNVRAAPQVAALRARMPTIPAMYAEELARMLAMQSRFGIASQIVTMRFPGARGGEIVDQLLRIKRGLDLYWQSMEGGVPVVAVLMPFASPAGKEGYINRIDGWLQSRFGGGFEALRIDITAIDSGRDDVVGALARAMTQPS